VQYFDQAGNTAYRSANTNITGTARVEDDRLCQRFEGYFLDRTMCGYVYRNTGSDGPAAGGQQDDYVHVTPDALRFFSLEQ
jgi:adenylate cyclase